MNTRKIPMSALIADPNTATTQAGGGQTNNPSTVVPSLSATAPAYKSAMDAAMVAFAPSLLNLPPAEANHHAKVDATDKQVIDIAITMLRTDPTLSGSYTADSLQAVVDDADACADLSHDLGNVMTQVINTGRLRLETASQAASEIVKVGRQRAPRSTLIAKDVAEIDALRATGPKAEKAEQVAVLKQQKATRANARATKANAEAATATARANSLQDGTGDATITQPAPAAPAATTPPTGTVPTR